MADMMMFPKTVDEFMEQYKIVDTDKVYTNGTEFVPIFRMKQWFEHVEAEPIRHGQWEDKYDDGDWHCSVCDAIVEKDEQGRHNWNRCYHCGSKMGGVDK